MKKRLFVGLPLSPAILAVCRNFRKHTEQKHLFSAESGRWISATNLHVTVCFLGSLDEKLLPGIKDAIGAVMAKTKPFSLTLQHIELAPPGAKPRMVWAVFAANENFKAFSAQLTKSLKTRLYQTTRHRFNFREHREIIPHVTLARFKPTKIIEPLELATDLSIMKIEQCNLYESRTFPTGAQYTILEKFLLAA